MPTNREWTLPSSIRFGAYLAILFGAVGVFAGLSGAATYLPYRIPDALTLQTAEILTAIAAFGAFTSALVIVSGWGLLRAKDWAWGPNLAAAVGCIVTVCVLAAAMPASSPSPVPGGIGVIWLVPVVTLVYALEVLLLLIGRWSQRAHPVRGAPG